LTNFSTSVIEITQQTTQDEIRLLGQFHRFLSTLPIYMVWNTLKNLAQDT